MKNNTKSGLYWILIPIVVLIFTLFSFAIANGRYVQSIDGDLLKIINFALGLLGLLSVIAVPVGAVIGIIYFFKSD